MGDAVRVDSKLDRTHRILLRIEFVECGRVLEER